MTFESTRPVPQTIRTVERIGRGTPASDGAGVRLNRIIGKPGLPDLDPFLLLDEFRSDEASDYLGGLSRPSASRLRDRHLYAGGQNAARRQPRQCGTARAPAACSG